MNGLLLEFPGCHDAVAREARTFGISIGAAVVTPAPQITCQCRQRAHDVVLGQD
jgi:hypothetical protein